MALRPKVNGISPIDYQEQMAEAEEEAAKARLEQLAGEADHAARARLVLSAKRSIGQAELHRRLAARLREE